MKNKKIILLSIFILVMAVAIFLFFTFKDKKTKVVFQFEENKAQEETYSSDFQETEKKREADEPKIGLEKKNVAVDEKSQTSFKITDNLVNWGFENSSGRKIDTIIIHSSYNALGGDEYDFKKLLQEYKEYGVAPHYVIDRKGNVFNLVAEKDIAYHAGASQVPDGRTGVNNFSVGIEIMSTKSDGPSSAQYTALKNLIADIKSRYKIKYVLGHSQIASGRKDDPWSFDWDKI